MNKKPGTIAYIGLGVLAVIWIWLAWGIFSTKGFNLYNLLVVAMAGIIIFVPVYKKYFKVTSSKKDDDSKGLH